MDLNAEKWTQVEQLSEWVKNEAEFKGRTVNGVNSLGNANDLGHILATETIQAESYTSGSNFQIYDDCPNVVYLGQLSAATVLQYDQVDFGTGVQRVTLRASNLYSGDALDVSLHTGSSTNSAFATVPLNFTGNDRCGFVEVDFTLDYFVNGTQNLFVTFPSGTSGYVNLDWLVFNTTAPKFMATDTIQIEDCSYQYDCIYYQNTCSEYYVSPQSSNSYIRFDQVDFGTVGLQSVTLRLSNIYSGSNSLVDLHLGSSTNAPIAKIPISYSGSSCDFITVNFTLAAPVTGVQYLFLTFPSAYAIYLNLDWLVFAQPETQFEATEKMEAEDYTSGYSIELYDDCTDVRYVGSLSKSSLLEFDMVDFGASGVDMVILRVSNFYAGPPLDVALHLGNSTSSPFVTLPVGQTGSDRCNFLVLDAFLDPKPVGVQNLFITFPSAVGGYLRLDWLQFKRTSDS